MTSTMAAFVFLVPEALREAWSEMLPLAGLLVSKLSDSNALVKLRAMAHTLQRLGCFWFLSPAIQALSSIEPYQQGLHDAKRLLDLPFLLVGESQGLPKLCSGLDMTIGVAAETFFFLRDLGRSSLFRFAAHCLQSFKETFSPSNAQPKMDGGVLPIVIAGRALNRSLEEGLTGQTTQQLTTMFSELTLG